MSYSPPSSAKPFTLSIPDQELSEWRQLLHLSKLGPKTFENLQSERYFGVTYKWLSEAKDHWLKKYDWRVQEKHINSFPNYMMMIEEIDVHFVGLFSEKKDAIPIIFMHSWPGSFIEFLPMCQLVKDKYSPRDQPYHIIVPSLPGYTLSSGGPQDKDWSMHDSARIMNQLMINLGFSKYIAQGGDVGSFVARIMATSYEQCVGVHLNMLPVLDLPDPSTLAGTEKSTLERVLEWRQTNTAYALEQGTRPSTIGHVVSSNPLALLAWIGEKLLEWTDETPAMDIILTNISLYWFTQSFPRCIYLHRTIFNGPPPPWPPISKPTGFSFFRYELFPPIESLIKKDCNLVFSKEHTSGGHFGALEKPVEMLEDVEEFVKMVWKM
ncbi:epoxide hydrolase-like protein [Lindgomyces ingoldianus]|uniref:Epoxide hydrolase-like protein n=1 Tax=Lindgomyces ingoldianus TaxID=673940 RepID=A0ACB6QLB4_9PLEO|nr:epoxide hydrolase-like protein [Lindgomyces ingoldianus]KAF2467733.1 epoxide hydrolase-like protein [Lindgomyces ingoldianus]